MALITSANARQLGAKGRAKQIEAAQAAKARLALMDELIAKAAQDSSQAAVTAYLSRRLKRVRAQVERLSDLLDGETDPAKLDRLASALERLAEMERLYDGRPVPGTLRPQADKSVTKSSPVEPSPVRPNIPTPAPVPPAKPLLSEPPDL